MVLIKNEGVDILDKWHLIGGRVGDVRPDASCEMAGEVYYEKYVYNDSCMSRNGQCAGRLMD